MLTINTKQPLVSLKGEALKEGENDVTIGAILSNVLSGRVDNAYLGYVLAKKFALDDSVDLKAEEVVFIKKEIQKPGLVSALVGGQIIEILDSK